MKKIGIVPLEYNSYNYGGTLQCYALQRALLNANCEVNVFDFDERKGDHLFPDTKNDNKLSLKTNFKKRIQKVLNLIYQNKINDRKTNFDNFRKRYFANKQCINPSDLAEISKQFDCFVCGSDQIWNPHWCNSTHFLTFVPNYIPKVSYAASIGVDNLSNEEKELFKPMIEDFNMISVRETRAQEVLQSFVSSDKNVEVVLDPTLLLTANDWDRILTNEGINEKYIFTYFLGEDASLRDYAILLAKELGYKIVNIPFLYGDVRKADLMFGDIRCSSAGPEDFIKLIKNAELVLTDSFHACVFSMIYHKNFYAFDRKLYGKSMSSRITGLLDSVGISGHIIDTNYPINSIITSSINYDKVDRKLNVLRKDSYKFLNKIMEL